MNPKQVVQAAPALVSLAAIAPPVVIGGLIGLGIVFVLKAIFDSDKEKQPEAMPAKPEAEASRKPAETAVFRPIQAAIPAKPVAVAPVLSAPRPASVPVQPAKPAPAASVKTIPKIPSIQIPPPVVPPVSVPSAPVPAKPPSVAKKLITRKDLAAIFENGKKTLARSAAVAALRRLGFGKSAAYAALSPDGRFSTWLTIAPDGIISWKI